MKIKKIGKRNFPTISITCANPRCQAELEEINAHEVNFHPAGRTNWLGVVCPVCGHETEVAHAALSAEFLADMTYHRHA